jgi:hypothetical protein
MEILRKNWKETKDQKRYKKNAECLWQAHLQIGHAGKESLSLKIWQYNS